MSDLSRAIEAKSDQLNSDDLMAGPLTIRITRVAVAGTAEQPVSIFFENDGNKPWKPCKSMTKLLVMFWGPDSSTFPGKSVTLFRDPAVKWGGMAVGGIRISHMSDIKGNQTVPLTETRGVKKPYTVRPLAAPDASLANPAAITSAVLSGSVSGELAPPAAAGPAVGPVKSLAQMTQEALDKCATPDDVHDVMAKPRVKKALADGAPAMREELGAMFNAAHKRVALPEDGHPDDEKPAEDHGEYVPEEQC